MGPAVPRPPCAEAGDDQQGEEDAVERVGGERTVPLDLIDQYGADPLRFTLAAMAGLLIIQVCGLLNLIIGAEFERWQDPLAELLFSYSLGPLAAQLALCCAAGLLARGIRRLLWVE